MAKGGDVSIYQTEQESFDINEPSFQSFLKRNNIEFSPVGGAVRGDYYSFMFYGTKPVLKKMLMKYWLMDESLEDANRLAEEQIEEETYAKGGGVGYKKDWLVTYITMQGKVGKKTITLGRMSDKTDVKNALKRMDLNIREVTSISEGDSYAKGGDVSEANKKYKVVKIFRKSGRKEILEKNLTRAEAMRVVNSYPNSNTSMVVFYEMFKDGGDVGYGDYKGGNTSTFEYSIGGL